MSVLPFAEPFGWYAADRSGRPGQHFRWNPFFRDFADDIDRELERTDRMMNLVGNNGGFGSLEGALPVQELGTDMRYNENGDLSLRYQTAGFRPEEICVDLDGDMLTVSGRHVETKEEQDERQQREGGRVSASQERFFTRRIRLDPTLLDASRIQCQLGRNGELCICVPRANTPAIQSGQQQPQISHQQQQRIPIGQGQQGQQQRTQQPVL